VLKAVIFDMDGVLVNSTKYNWQSFNIMLQEKGVQFLEPEIKRFLGKSLKDIIKIWSEEYGITGLDPVEFSKKSAEIQFKLMEKELIPEKNLIVFLDKLKKNNIKMAVATSSTKWRAEKMLELLKITNYFQAIVTAEDVKLHKPHPDVFLEAAKRLKEKPIDCIVFEDASDGVEAAKKGNMKVIAIKTEYKK
jgi:HAD superfamily hydrolase (TIGR01509 family)